MARHRLSTPEAVATTNLTRILPHQVLTIAEACVGVRPLKGCALAFWFLVLELAKGFEPPTL